MKSFGHDVESAKREFSATFKAKTGNAWNVCILLSCLSQKEKPYIARQGLYVPLEFDSFTPFRLADENRVPSFFEIPPQSPPSFLNFNLPNENASPLLFQEQDMVGPAKVKLLEGE